MANFVTRKTEKEALTAGLAAEIFQRLPSNILPDNYLVCLKPNWKNLSFEGSEIVHLTIFSESREVVLNASDLMVGKIMWEEDVTENRQEPLEFTVDQNNELLKIVFEPPLNPSKGTLRINFTGLINGKGLKGMYRPKRFTGRDDQDVEDDQSDVVEHHDHHHDQHIVDDTFTLATNFQFTYARRCFPCWDEPGIKASFDLCVILPKELIPLSNMPIKVMYPHRSKKALHTVEFRQTPVMSTYLLCLCIGKFECVWKLTADNFLSHVYTDVASRKRLGQKALNFLVQIVPFFNDYFTVNLGLPKLDIIALPECVPICTEHWGAITFEEAHLMVDADSSPEFIQQMLVRVAHATSHQWWGNLVSMRWFTYLWLNEGFATFLSFVVTDKFYPQYDMWPRFICDCQLKAMESDASRFSRAVECNINNPSDTTELYDTNSYFKSASLVRMLFHYLGENQFRAGLTLYLESFQHKTAVTGDLWAIFQQVSDKPIEAIMAKWTTAPGFPIIKVAAKQRGNHRMYTLTQERYYTDPAVRERAAQRDKDPVWIIPITFASAARPELTTVIMDKKMITVSVFIGKSHWVSINPEQGGFFRVRYSPECFTQFLSAVRQKTLPVLEKLGMLSDLFAMIQGGLSSTVEILSVLEAFIDDTSYYVWKLIASIISLLHTLLESTEFYGKYLSYVRSILAVIEGKTAWDARENEGPMMTSLRTLILTMLVGANQVPVIQEAQKRFELFTRGDMVISCGIKIPVYQAALKYADEETIRNFLKMYRECDSYEERGRIARSLGLVRSEDKIKLVLEFSVSDLVQTEHSLIIMSTLAVMREGREVMWGFFKEHLTVFRHRYAGGSLMAKVVRIVTEHFVTEEKMTEVAEFFREHHVPGTERVVLLSCEKIRLNDAWLKRDLLHIQDYLSSYP